MTPSSAKQSPGVVTVQTKSGSNEIHGSGFWYRRTDATRPRSVHAVRARSGAGEANPIRPSRWQQFGGGVGGPIIKNKLFFFADYQATRQKSGITNQETIPTALLKSSCAAGVCDFSDYASIIANHGSPTSTTP